MKHHSAGNHLPFGSVTRIKFPQFTTGVSTESLRFLRFWSSGRHSNLLIDLPNGSRVNWVPLTKMARSASHLRDRRKLAVPRLVTTYDLMRLYVVPGQSKFQGHEYLFPLPSCRGPKYIWDTPISLHPCLKHVIKRPHSVEAAAEKMFPVFITCFSPLRKHGSLHAKEDELYRSFLTW